MALGKNKRNFNKGRKGNKRKTGERFLKKEWWTIRAPGMFPNHLFTKSPVNVTQGETFASNGIRGRVFEVNHADLNNDCTHNHQKFKLIVDEAIEGGSKEARTNFYGMDTAKHHISSIIRKWHSLIESFVDVKTKDGFLMRFFCIANTKRMKKQLRATCYAQTSQIKQIRKIMTNTITKEVKRHTLKEVTKKLAEESIPKEITKLASKIHPIQNCLIRKVKTLKRPRVDIVQLNSMHADVKTAVGAEPAQETVEESKNLLDN